MDATTQAFLAALIGAVVAGGAVLAWHVSDRQQHHATVPTEEPVVPAGVATVLSVLRSSAVVVDDSDVVLKASAPAYAMGLVRGTALVSAELADAGPAGTPRRADPRDRAGDGPPRRARRGT